MEGQGTVGGVKIYMQVPNRILLIQIGCFFRKDKNINPDTRSPPLTSSWKSIKPHGSGHITGFIVWYLTP